MRDAMAVIGQWSTNQSDMSLYTPISVKITQNMFSHLKIVKAYNLCNYFVRGNITVHCRCMSDIY